MTKASLQAIFAPGTFRLLLASVVVLDHYTGLMVGRAAVYLFFVLSGFWIHTMWVERYQKVCRPYFTFVVSRIWRLMPAMLVASALAIAVRLCFVGDPVESLWADGIFHTTFSHLFLIGYSNLEQSRLVAPAWSLDIEMQFYLVAPLLAAMLARLPVVAFAVLCAILTIYDVTPAAFDALGWFAVGMIASSYGRRPPRIMALASLIAMPVLLTVVAVMDLSYLIDRLFMEPNRYINVATAILGIPIALHTCFCSESPNGHQRGNLSYVIYLVHWPLMAFTEWMQQLHLLAGAIPALLILPISLAILRWVDGPAQRARAKWVAGRMTTQVELAKSHQAADIGSSSTRSA